MVQSSGTHKVVSLAEVSKAPLLTTFPQAIRRSFPEKVIQEVEMKWMSLSCLLTSSYFSRQSGRAAYLSDKPGLHTLKARRCGSCRTQGSCLRDYFIAKYDVILSPCDFVVRSWHMCRHAQECIHVVKHCSGGYAVFTEPQLWSWLGHAEMLLPKVFINVLNVPEICTKPFIKDTSAQCVNCLLHLLYIHICK